MPREGEQASNAPRRRSAAAALDALIEESTAPAPLKHPADAVESVGDGSGQSRQRLRRVLSTALFLAGFGGLLTDAIAAAQLLEGSGSGALGIVWPIGGAMMLITAAAQFLLVDRLPRRTTLVVMSSGIAALLGVALVLELIGAPSLAPAILEWVAADQLNFLVPLVLWSVAADAFVAGEAAVVFPRMSRWWFIGQGAGLVVATVAPLVMNIIGADVAAAVALPAVSCIAIAVVAGRLSGAPVVGRADRAPTLTVALSDTVEFVRALPAFRRLFVMSVLVMAAGVTVEFGFLDSVGTSTRDAGTMQVLYSAVSLVGFAICYVVQSSGIATAVQRRGVASGLLLLPASAAVAALLSVLHGLGGGIIAASVGLLAWRIPRWSIDATVRQTALATVPDHRRTRVSMVIDLAPWAIGLCLVAVPIGIGRLVGESSVVPAAGALLAGSAVVIWYRLGDEWDDAQLSYRLKRRQRAR